MPRYLVKKIGKEFTVHKVVQSWLCDNSEQVGNSLKYQKVRRSEVEIVNPQDLVEISQDEIDKAVNILEP